MQTNNKLDWDEFEATSPQAWKQIIQMGLKGADYNDTLVWKTPEGIHVKPFYCSDDIPEDKRLNIQHPSEWFITERLDITGDNYFQQAEVALNKGAEAIYFTADSSFDIQPLSKHLNVPLLINCSFLDQDFFNQIKALPSKALLLFDPIHQLITDGNWFKNKNEDFSALNSLTEQQHQLYIDARIYAEAGANLLQQICYSTSHLMEYINQIKSAKTIKKVIIDCGIGGNYFFEIAKLRSLRLIVEQMLDFLNNDAQVILSAQPIKRNKSIYDYNVNMLRTTTECMSAVLGSCDMVSNLDYDCLYKAPNEFGTHISRNQLLILKNESYFDAVANPASGSYYIESITQQFSEKAIALIKEIEASGGFMKQLMDGTIQRKIKEAAAQEQKAFDELEKVAIGVNKYPNKEDAMKTAIERNPFSQKYPRKTLIEPIMPKRLAEKLEKERLDHEQNRP